MQKNKSTKFIEFNGTRISVLTKDGQWWVAVKPICSAIGIDFQAQHKRITADRILSRVSSNQTTHDATNRLQEMFCLPEKYIYGWLFSVQSDKPELDEFKLTCYDLLFNHFHVTSADHLAELTQRAQIDMEIDALEEELKQVPVYQKIQELKGRKKFVDAKIRKQQKETIEWIQLDLFSAS